MRVSLPYGSRLISLEADEKNTEWHVIKSGFSEAIQNTKQNFIESCHNPIESPRLREIIKPTDRVIVVTCDGTRSFPNKLILPWLLDELNIPDDRVTILLGNGTHRKNTPDELVAMFGDEIFRRLRIINHNCSAKKDNRFVGITSTKGRVSLNRRYVEAEKRIVLGFIEPHFFAGFSGGAKGVVPGVAALETIMRVHRSDLIVHPDSTWAEVERNPFQHEIQEMVSMCPPDFLINVTLNAEKQITGFFSGDYNKAHVAGCTEVAKNSIVSVNERYPLVVTTNGGYPLDQNLYQTVKGISAAARIVEPGGTILVVSECRDGIPAHGQFAKLMSKGSTPDEVSAYLRKLKNPVVDQWQAQILSALLQQAKIMLYSSLKPDDVNRFFIKPVKDLQKEINRLIGSEGKRKKIAVLQEGPCVIPCVKMASYSGAPTR